MQYPQLPEFIFITDRARANPFEVCPRLPAGSAVILRDYDLPENEREKLALELKQLCKIHNLLLLIGKTPELARKIQANGVHLPEFMLPKAAEICRKNPHWMVTIAAHTGKNARKAALAKVSAVIISPIFKTLSHPDKGGIGIHRAKKMIPPHMACYALGGVKARQLNQMKSVGFQGVAFVSGIN